MSLGNVLVTGGAGYIGSHCVLALKNKAARIIVLDNLSTGFKEALPSDVVFYKGDVNDTDLLHKLFSQENITACIHLAAATIIPESIADPLKYYQNNTMGTLKLLKACLANHVHQFIFSSTAAVYGHPEQELIDETHPLKAENPYGESKIMAEKLIQDVANSFPLRYVIFRYFNVAGADPNGQIGQRTVNATHLIKTAVETACKKRDSMPIYGHNYPTPDGTCIRDFIHVSDLADAHIKGLEYLIAGGKNEILNCGYGHGHSVQEVIAAVEKASRQKLNTYDAPPRQGDIPKVVANADRIKNILTWQGQYNNLDLIVQSALKWEKYLENLGVEER